MPSVARLAVSVVASSASFTRGMQRSSKAVKKFGLSAKIAAGMTKTMNAAMVRLAGIAGAAVLARGFFRLVRQQEMFSRALLQSQAIMGDLSEQMRGDMRQASIELARTTIFTAEQGAKAFFFLASAGLSAAQSLKALPLVGKFAQAGMFDLSLATDLLTDAQSALGLTTKDATQNLLAMTRVSDVLVKANTLANASVLQFSQALTTKAGAALKVLGKDIEEGVAVLAAFADQGLKASDAGTALQIVLRDLTTKAIRNSKAFAQAGIQVFDTAGEMRNIGTIIGDVERALKGMSDAQAKLTLLTLGFTDKSVIFIQTLLGMSGAIKEYEASLRSAGGTTLNVADKMLTPLQEALNEFKAAVSGSAEAVGFLNIVWTDFVAVSARNLEKINELISVGPSEVEKRLAAQRAGMRLFLRDDKALRNQLRRLDAIDAKRAERTVARRVARERALSSGAFGQPGTDLAAITSFQKQAERAQKALAEFGIPPLVLQLDKLRTAFFEIGDVGIADEYLKGASAIEQLIRAQKRLTVETRTANKAAQEVMDVERQRVSLYERTRTPQERFARQVADLEELQRKTLLLGGDETFRREMDRLRQQLSDALGGSQRRRGLEIKSLGLVAIGGRQQGTASKPQVVQSPQFTAIIERLDRANELAERPQLALVG